MVNRIFVSFYWNFMGSFRPICSYLRLQSAPVPQMTSLRYRQGRRCASCVAAALLLIPFIAPKARATIYTWDGNGGTGNSKWSTAGNWDANGIPASDLATTDLVFGGTFHLTPQMDTNYSIHSLSFAVG